MDLRNLQEQVKNAFYSKNCTNFSQINCFTDLKMFANYRPSASNFKSFSWSLEQFFLIVGQNNFGNKIPFLLFQRYVSRAGRFIPLNGSMTVVADAQKVITRTLFPKPSSEEFLGCRPVLFSKKHFPRTTGNLDLHKNCIHKTHHLDMNYYVNFLGRL